MPPSSVDHRKQFILTTTGNFFGWTVSPHLADSAELNNFLDDGNEFVLCFSQQQHDLHLSNQVVLHLYHKHQTYMELEQFTSSWPGHVPQSAAEQDLQSRCPCRLRVACSSPQVLMAKLLRCELEQATLLLSVALYHCHQTANLCRSHTIILNHKCNFCWGHVPTTF